MVDRELRLDLLPQLPFVDMVLLLQVLERCVAVAEAHVLQFEKRHGILPGIIMVEATLGPIPLAWELEDLGPFLKLHAPVQELLELVQELDTTVLSFLLEIGHKLIVHVVCRRSGRSGRLRLGGFIGCIIHEGRLVAPYALPIHGRLNILILDL